MNRRQFLQQAAFASVVLASAGSLSGLAEAKAHTEPAQSQSNQAARTPQAGYYWMPLGEASIAALSDGTLHSGAKLLNGAPGLAENLLKQSYAAADPIISVNAFLILMADRRILVDAGTGTILGPTLNKLAASLSGTGFKPEQITDILLTHVHADHSGGLTQGGNMVFPNATVRVNRVEAEFWLSAENMRKAKEYYRPMFVKAKESLTPYLDAGRITTFETGHEILPGITATASPGHTPGHTHYTLESRGEKIVFWGDTVHVAEAQFPHPELGIEYDLDADGAALQRQRAFAQAAAQGYLVAGAHISFPGIGHVRKAENGYQWIPVPYSNDASA